MPGVVVDTHTIVWYLSDDPLLSDNAGNALDSATAAGQIIHVPSICLVELTYVIEKRRLPAAARDELLHAVLEAFVRMMDQHVARADGRKHAGAVLERRGRQRSPCRIAQRGYRQRCDLKE